MFRRISEALRRFMYGRNGTDQFNILLLVSAVVITLIGSLLSQFGVVCKIISLVLSALSYALLFFALFRMLSRNLYARGRENRKFMGLLNRLKDRKNRCFRCPQCKQLVRVPKGRGKICIKCPKCGEKFIRKS